MKRFTLLTDLNNAARVAVASWLGLPSQLSQLEARMKSKTQEAVEELKEKFVQLDQETTATADRMDARMNAYEERLKAAGATDDPEVLAALEELKSDVAETTLKLRTMGLANPTGEPSSETAPAESLPVEPSASSSTETEAPASESPSTATPSSDYFQDSPAVQPTTPSIEETDERGPASSPVSDDLLKGEPSSYSIRSEDD